MPITNWCSFNPRAHAGRDQQPYPVTLRNSFQSTRPRGARPADAEAISSRAVSIHAPTRGATIRRPGFTGQHCFNPRAHAGRDRCRAKRLSLYMFQSTRPRGARQHPPNQLNLIAEKPRNCEPIKTSARHIINHPSIKQKHKTNQSIKSYTKQWHFMLASGSHYNNNKPFKSSTAFAPICSIRRSQLLPR